ncbi:MAG: hypothetical protein WC325_11450, partial [Candidatus Bathyarchaeia archaeon]
MLVKRAFVQGKVIPKLVSKSGERIVAPYDPNQFRYIRFRAIGNLEVDGQNGNGDGFPYQYFEDERPGFGFGSFRNKHAHVEHTSDLGYDGAIGDLPDAYLNRFIYPSDYPRRFSDLSPQQRMKVLNSPNQRDGS